MTRAFVSVLVLGVALCPRVALAQQCVQPPAGLVGWWSGDGHANDVSGNNLHGTVVGDGVTYAPGKAGLAFRFDNGSGKVLLAHHPLLDPTGALTLEAWVQPWEPPQENLGEVLHHVGAAGGGYYLGMAAYFDATAYAIAGISHGPGSGHDALAGPAMPIDQWYHVVAAYDSASQRYRLYVNGEDIYGTGRDLLSPDPINYFDPPAGLSIGNALAPRGGIDRGFYGLIDEVRVFNRALSAAEVQGLHAAGGHGVCKALTIAIDVRPGAASNPVSCQAGLIDVAILSTRVVAGDARDFDATSVDPLSVRFGREGVEAPEAHNRGHLSDVDGDGDIDMILHFRMNQTGLQCADTSVVLTGRTSGGESFVGSDSIRRVGRLQ